MTFGLVTQRRTIHGYRHNHRRIVMEKEQPMAEITMDEFVRTHSISAKAERREANPNMDSEHEMDHWSVTLERPGERPMVVVFSKGIGHRTVAKFPHAIDPRGTVPYCRWDGCGERWPCHGAVAAPPTASEVLDCLASDASSYDNTQDFEDWAGDYGYDTDSRKAEHTYRAIAEQAKALRVFVDADYDELLYNVERL